MFSKGRREVRYPDQVKPARLYIGIRPEDSQAMIVHDSIHEQLLDHAKSMQDERRRRRIYKHQGKGVLEYVMMRTVDLPEHDWLESTN